MLLVLLALGAGAEPPTRFQASLGQLYAWINSMPGPGTGGPRQYLKIELHLQNPSQETLEVRVAEVRLAGRPVAGFHFEGDRTKLSLAPGQSLDTVVFGTIPGALVRGQSLDIVVVLSDGRDSLTLPGRCQVDEVS